MGPRMRNSLSLLRRRHHFIEATSSITKLSSIVSTDGFSSLGSPPAPSSDAEGLDSGSTNQYSQVFLTG
jgi:hypothetical protein